MKFNETKTLDVVGLGNALMDLLVEVPDEFLAAHNLTKGKMHLVDETVTKQYLRGLADHDIKTAAGGAAGNAIKGVGFLGGQAVFHGMVGDDIYGDMYRDSLKHAQVDVRIGTDALHTGHAVTYITPDSERTFTVYLGAALTLMPEHLDEASIAAAKVLHLEAFQLEGPTKETVLTAIALAKQHGTMVSMDLADASLIERNFDLFTELVANDIDIVFANETEGIAFTGTSGEAALAELAARAQIAVVKLGEAGSLIAHQGTVHKIAAVKTTVVDTTGAGDMYAAGFLYGLTQGWELDKAGELGAKLAAKIVAQVGVGMDTVTKD